MRMLVSVTSLLLMSSMPRVDAPDIVPPEQVGVPDVQAPPDREVDPADGRAVEPSAGERHPAEVVAGVRLDQHPR